jgi:methyl-accepting chemotaxis protein
LDCVSKHAAFHRVAGQVAETISAGKSGDANLLLEAGSPFSKASTAVAVAITTLKKSLGG